MSEYYKIAATVPEPGFEESPTLPRRGSKKSIPSTQPKYPDDRNAQEYTKPSAPPVDESQTKWDPYESPPPYSENGQRLIAPDQKMKPADIKPKYRECCKICERTMRRLLPLILLFFYTLLGGMAFHYIETKSQSESEVAKGHRALVDQPEAKQLEERMREIVLDANYTREKRKEEITEALLWYFRQLTVAERARWDFTSAVFYSMTLYTTIGYGNTPPHTAGGQVFTVFYSLIGIPLCLAALIELGFLVGFAVSKLWTCARRGWSAACGRRRRTTKSAGDWEALPSSSDADRDQREMEEMDDTDLLSFPLWALILLTFLWILITAALFFIWERHNVPPNGKPFSFLESLYFTFISFTTIGLGDYVPETTNGKLWGIIFLLIGLSLVSTTFAVLQQQMEAMQKSMQRSIDQEYQEAIADTGEAMPTDERAVDDNLRNIASKMPPATRLLYHLMPEERKKNLRQYYAKKAAMIPKAMQTDDYLWAMTHMSRSYLKRIAEDAGAIDPLFAEDTKSRDDVNSLVALCDLTLAPGHQMDF